MSAHARNVRLCRIKTLPRRRVLRIGDECGLIVTLVGLTGRASKVFVEMEARIDEPEAEIITSERLQVLSARRGLRRLTPASRVAALALMSLDDRELLFEPYTALHEVFGLQNDCRFRFGVPCVCV